MQVPSSHLGTEELTQAIAAATVALVTSHGPERVTVRMIAEEAGTTAGEVVRLVGDEDSCRLRAFEAVCEQVDCLLLPIYLRPEPWQERISMAAQAAVRFCRENEDRVRFAVEERLRRGHIPLGEASLRLHLQQIDAVRGAAADPARIPAAAAELSLGAFLETLVSLHMEGELSDLEQVVPSLLYNTFRIYLGIEAADDLLKTLDGSDGRQIAL